MFHPETYRLDPRYKNGCWELNHRWRRANYLVNAGKKPSKVYDDDVTRRAYQYLRVLARWRNGEVCRSHPYDFREIQGAYQCNFYLSPLRRAELEARMLAGQGNAAIAERFALPTEVVSAFHELFYDVRPHLNDVRIIAHLALRWWPDPEDADHTEALKLFGFSLGSRAVDALLHYIVDPPDAAVGTVNAPEAAWHRAAWEKLLEQMASALKARAWMERTDRLVSLVNTLRVEGNGLVAEGVDIPVPSPSIPERDGAARMWTGPKTWPTDSEEGELEEELLLVDDEEYNLG